MNAVDALIGAVEYAAKAHRDERLRMIRTVRIARDGGVSIARLATAAGVHRSTVYDWLKDRDPTGPHGGGADRQS